MDTFWHLVAGFTIGLQGFAALYVFRILRKTYTPTSPYVYLLLAQLFIFTIKFDYFLHFIDPHVRLILQLATSTFNVLGFIKIFILLNNKYE